MKRSTSVPHLSFKQLKTNNDESTRSLISTFSMVKHNIVCSASALNNDRNLILIYSSCEYNRWGLNWISGLFGEERAIDIFTLEGYHVTRKLIGKKRYTRLMIGNARFTDHMIMICDGLFRTTILTDFSLKFPFSQHKTVFVEFDETGNIYTNGERNKIAVYSQNLEFKEMFEIDLPNDSIIVSLHIRDDTMVVLSYNTVHIQFFTVSRFVRSTRKLVNYFELARFSHQHSNEICIDEFKNIIVSTGNGIRIWQRNGALRRIMFDAKEFIRILLTDNSQIILIFPNGRVNVYRLIDMVNYLC